MTSHSPRKHPVAFGAWAPRKSEIVYYNLQFWLFFAIILDFSGPGHIFSGKICRKVDVACDVVRVLDTICVTSKSLRTSHFFISRKTQNYLAMNENASIYIGSKPHESFRMTYHTPRRHPVAFGA